MTTPPRTFRISRRAVMQGGIGAGLAMPATLAVTVAARQQDAQPTAEHSAIGLWTGLGHMYPPGEYYLLHADGTGNFYSRYPREYRRRNDPRLPVTGFMLWRPVDASVMDAVLYLAWGDASLDTQLKIRQRWTVDDTGATATIVYRIEHLDSYGNPIDDPFVHLDGEYDVTRETWEPFADADSATPQASPVT